MIGLELFLNHRELVENTKKRLWETYFNPSQLRNGAILVKNEVAEGVSITGKPGGIVLGGGFEERHTYAYTTIEFFLAKNGAWILEPSCDCAAARPCKHVAALMISLTESLDAVSQIAEKGPLLGTWLNELSLAQNTSKKSDTPEKKETRFLAYCIGRSPQSYREIKWQLTLHVGNTLKSGKINLNLNSQATASVSRPHKYMVPDDTLAVAVFQELQRGHYGFGGVILEGDLPARLVELAAKTGRLFFINPELQGHDLLELGDPITLSPAWEALPDGSSKPILDSDIGTYDCILPTEPPYLVSGLDELILPLDTTRHNLAFLQSWLKGPQLPPDDVVKAVIELEKSTLALPRPTPAKTKLLKAVTPGIYLHLLRKNPFNHGGLHFSGRPEPVTAHLSFQYHDHRYTPDLSFDPPEKAQFTASKKGEIYSIPRDTKTEKESTLLLVNEHRFVPASVVDPDVASHSRSAFLPQLPPASWDAAAAEFLINSVPLLREKGWEITIDPSADLEVTTIAPGHLETSLNEDPEHGIDWFRFDASYLTPEGDQQPLLPLLSEFLRTVDFAKIDELIAAVTDEQTSITPDPNKKNAFVALPTKRLLILAKTLHELFGDRSHADPIHRIQAAGLADVLEMDGSQTLKDLAKLGSNLKNITELPKPEPPKNVTATLRDYQLDGFHWMQFLARHGLHGILADDMGLGKTLQALTHIQAEVFSRRTGQRPTLVLAPTSVVANWKKEAAKFTPKLKTLLLHGSDRKEHFKDIDKQHLVITSYPLVVRDFSELQKHDFHLLILDEAQYIKNPAAKVSQLVCKLSAAHRLSLSGTPLENHLGELWSQMRFLMPGLLGSSQAFAKHFRTPIEKHGDRAAQLALNSRVAPLILRRTKDQVATELPPKTEIIHTIPLNEQQVDVYETVRAAMDDRVRDAIADKGLAKSQIIVLDALLKLRQICCHPQLLKLPAAQKIQHSAKLDFLTEELLPTLLDEGRKILLFSTFTTMLALIEEHLIKKKILFSKITGSTKDRQKEIDEFQEGNIPIFLISLKAGGTGLNLTAADTVIHYDPWWNPAAENQATDRAHRIGQDKPVFVHKLITEGSIEERIVQLQSQKAKLVEALLSEKTTRLQLDQETLGNLLAPLE